MREEEIRSFIVRNDWLAILLNGDSPIDKLGRMETQDNVQADRILTTYGYDTTNQVEMMEAFGYFQEALDFINGVLLVGIDQKVPDVITQISDVRHLTVMASQTRDQIPALYQHWACACLKVMHVISHIDKDLRDYYFQDAKKQILDRINSVLYRENDKLYLVFPSGAKHSIRKFQLKERKPRKSLILKLLFKPEVSAGEVYDHLGCKFVVDTVADIFPVLKGLMKSGLVQPPNVKPGRTRNNLINLDEYESSILKLTSDLRANAITPEEFREMLSRNVSKKESSTINPNSLSTYRSIQFTSRHLIKVPNKALAEIKRIKDWARENSLKLPEIDMKHLSRETHFFYPFEVQIFDWRSHLDAEEGDSSHELYKSNQVKYVRDRLLSRILNTH